jgi:hypothetical protein
MDQLPFTEVWPFFEDTDPSISAREPLAPAMGRKVHRTTRPRRPSRRSVCEPLEAAGCIDGERAQNPVCSTRFTRLCEVILPIGISNSTSSTMVAGRRLRPIVHITQRST